MNPAPGYLTVPEAALRLSISEDRVRKLIAHNELPAARVGRNWLIPLSEVEHRLASRPSRGRRLTPARSTASCAVETQWTCSVPIISVYAPI
jgi:excisionase family DNA binding protein